MKKPLKRLTKSTRTSLLLMAMTFLGTITFAQPTHAIEFSFLLGNTEEMVKTCVLADVTSFDAIINIFFYGGRAVVFGLFAWNLFRGIAKSNRNQNGDENFLTVGVIIVAVIIVGIIEPAFARSCGGTGGGAQALIDALASLNG